ncbi:hypothetical protein, partial [Mesorhizobium sp. M7A.T.Ca.US.000.02.2.1]
MNEKDNSGSVLDMLTREQRSELFAWADQQPSSPGKSIDLMTWPGWDSFLSARFIEVTTRPGRMADRIVVGSEAKPAALDVAKAVLLAGHVSPKPSEAREALRVLVSELAYQWDVLPCGARRWAEAVVG